MAGVPDQRIAGGLEDPVQRERELDRAEVGTEMPAAGGDRIDQDRANLRSQLPQLRSVETLQVGWAIDVVEEHALRTSASTGGRVVTRVMLPGSSRGRRSAGTGATTVDGARRCSAQHCACRWRDPVAIFRNIFESIGALALLFLVFLIATFPVTWLLMLFFGNVGAQLSYWAVLPLGVVISLIIGAGSSGGYKY